MLLCPQPSYHLYEICFRHSRATSCWPIHTASNMKKNRAACTRDWRIGIVPNLDKPMIRKVARAHFFMGVVVRWIFRINDDMTIVIWRARIIAPNIRFRHLTIWIIGPRRQVRIVTKNFADFENSRGRSSIALFLSKSRLILPGEPCPPRDPVFSKQYRERSSHRRPIAAARPLEQSHLSAH